MAGSRLPSSDPLLPPTGAASSQLVDRLRRGLTGGQRPNQPLVPAIDRAVSTLPNAPFSPELPLVKLEVISMFEMTAIRVAEAIAASFNLVYLLVVVCLARVRWAADASCAEDACAAVLLRGDFRRVVWFNAIFCATVAAVALLAALYIVITYWRRVDTKVRRPEVLWAIVLLLPTVTLTNNPLLNLDRIHIFFSSVSARASSGLAIARYVTNAYAVAGVTLYLILKFGAMESVTDLSDVNYSFKFYLSRVAPLLALFAAFTSLSIKRRTEFSPQAIVPLISLVRNEAKGGRFPFWTILSTIIVGLCQVFILVAFLVRYFVTSRRISKMNYREARLKTINIFFLYRHTITPLLSCTLGTAVATSLFPTTLIHLGAGDGIFTERYILDVPYFARSGVVLTYTTWALIECWSAYPSNYQPTAIERMVIERLNKARVLPRPPPQASFVHVVAQRHTSDDHTKKDSMEHNPSPQTSKDVSFSSSMAPSSPVVWEAERDMDEAQRSSTLRVSEAVLAFNLSWCAYLDNETINSVLKDSTAGRMVMRHVWRENAHDQCVFVAVSDDLIAIAFRGSVSATNMKVNLQMAHTRHMPEVEDEPEWLRTAWGAPAWAKVPKFHRGFDRAYSAMRDEILSAVGELHSQYPDHRVLCCGHSLGGALATLASFDVRVVLGLPENQVSCVTFGSPRVGNAPFARRLAAVVTDNYRFVNLHDFISKYPKRRLQGYTHVPRCALVTAEGNLILDPRFADLQMFHGSKLRAHVLTAYKTSIQAFIDKAQAGNDITEDCQYVPDWWDFSKYSEETDSRPMANYFECSGEDDSRLLDDDCERSDDVNNPDASQRVILRPSGDELPIAPIESVRSMPVRSEKTKKYFCQQSLQPPGRVKRLRTKTVDALLARIDPRNSTIVEMNCSPATLLGDDTPADEEAIIQFTNRISEPARFQHYHSFELLT